MATLRLATVADAAALTRLRGFMHASMGDSPSAEWVQLCTEAFARRLASEDFRAYVVDDGGRLVASGVGWLDEHLPSPYLLSGMRGHIASMSTDPDHRRRGYARQVFQALMDWFSSMDIKRVDLRATEDGRVLYEQFGFQVLGGASMSWFAPGGRAGLR